MKYLICLFLLISCAQRQIKEKKSNALAGIKSTESFIKSSNSWQLMEGEERTPLWHRNLHSWIRKYAKINDKKQLEAFFFMTESKVSYTNLSSYNLCYNDVKKKLDKKLKEEMDLYLKESFLNTLGDKLNLKFISRVEKTDNVIKDKINDSNLIHRTFNQTYQNVNGEKQVRCGVLSRIPRTEFYDIIRNARRMINPENFREPQSQIVDDYWYWRYLDE